MVYDTSIDIGLRSGMITFVAGGTLALQQPRASYEDPPCDAAKPGC
jgi:hypothetical protein